VNDTDTITAPDPLPPMSRGTRRARMRQGLPIGPPCSGTRVAFVVDDRWHVATMPGKLPRRTFRPITSHDRRVLRRAQEAA
jgi:hypothetical protein